MSNLEFEFGSDQEISSNHSKLLDAVTQLDKGQRVKKPLRSEPSLEVSEFHLVKSGVGEKNSIHLRDLAKTLGQRASHAHISKKFRAAQKKSRILLKPLEKPAAARIKRTVGFENVKKDLGKWDAIVSKNRTAEQLNFPLKQSSMKLQTTNEFVMRFRIRSDLEKQLAALEPEKVEKKEGEPEKFPMSLEEIIERRKETAKFRTQQSYKEAKAYRQNKIKSKKFHRIQRKERTKQQLKQFEELMKTDPEAALAKLEQLEKTRAEERISLRHKSTGQWAKNKQIRAKYDKESRQVLAQQLSISRDLTQKIRKEDESEDEEEDAVVPVLVADRENPWCNGGKSTSEIDRFISGYRKYWDDRDKLQKLKKCQEKGNEIVGQKKIEETFLVPQIKDLPEELNPVEEVIIEHSRSMFDDGSDDSIEYDSNEPAPSASKQTPTGKIKNNKSPSKESNDESVSRNSISDSIKPVKRNRKDSESLSNGSFSKKSKKSLGGKPNKKTTKKKIVKTVGTSGWAISLIESNASENELKPSDSLELDEMFDAIEDKIQDKVTSRLKNMKNKYRIKLGGGEEDNDNHRDVDDEYIGDLGFKNQKQRPVIDEVMNETPDRGGSEINKEIAILKKLANTNLERIPPNCSKEVEIDPNKFTSVRPKHLKAQLPGIITGGDEGLDDSDQEDGRKMISEAFADDDVMDEFRKEKDDEVKKGIPEDINLTLPGWGAWGGKNLSISNRKKRRFILKFPKDAPRKDANKGDVIIIEEKDPKIKEHQVNELPFPFTTIKDFEASIRAPLGRIFVPENAHRRLIRPAVTTKMGKIIEPMDDESLVNTKNMINSRKGFSGKKRNKRNVKT